MRDSDTHWLPLRIVWYPIMCVAILSCHRYHGNGLKATLEMCASDIIWDQMNAGWYKGKHDSDTCTKTVLRGSNRAASSIRRNAAIRLGSEKLVAILHTRQGHVEAPLSYVYRVRRARATAWSRW
jgi:hypothetical protein